MNSLNDSEDDATRTAESENCALIYLPTAGTLDFSKFGLNANECRVIDLQKRITLEGEVEDNILQMLPIPEDELVIIQKWNQTDMATKLYPFLCALRQSWSITIYASTNIQEAGLMTQFKNNNFGDVLLNCHSVRHFDKDVRIPCEELREMVRETITAPLACNLQAWQFIVVDTDEDKKKLHEFYTLFNNLQIDTSSVTIQIFGNTLALRKYCALWDHMYEEKRIPKEELDKVYNTFLPLYEHADKTMLTADVMADFPFAAMQLMSVARAHGYETNAMAGYDAKKAASVMGLDPEQYVLVMGIAIGKPDTSVQELKSVRYPADDILKFEQTRETVLKNIAFYFAKVLRVIDHSKVLKVK